MKDNYSCNNDLYRNNQVGYSLFLLPRRCTQVVLFSVVAGGVGPDLLGA